MDAVIQTDYFQAQFFSLLSNDSKVKMEINMSPSKIKESLAAYFHFNF
jgi:hypothetical protein